MSDRASHNLGGLEIDLARHIDEVCRRFEADWREGRQPRMENYLDGVSQEGQLALRAELEALERELGLADGAIALSGSGPIAEAPTIAPASPPTAPVPGLASPPVQEEATVPPRDDATVGLGSSAPAPPDASAPGRVRYFGDYEIEGELARGGMGVVFRTRQISLNRPVALKMILAAQLANDTDVKRFYTEAEAAANLDHPGIVPIFEVGQHEGQHFFSMGFVEGQSLSQRLADGPLPSREAAELVRRVSEAIEYAHRRGVIHRDLKPANILLDRDGNPRVTDFGLAKKVQGDSGLTGSGQIMGTPSYMPPEQAGGKRDEVGPAALIMGLGWVVEVTRFSPTGTAEMVVMSLSPLVVIGGLGLVAARARLAARLPHPRGGGVRSLDVRLPGDVLHSDIGDRGDPSPELTTMRCVLRSRMAACCWAAMMMLGCSRSVLTTEQGAALTAAEERWKLTGTRDYSFELHPFNGLAFGECAARIEVRGGAVKQVTRLGSLEPDSTTIDGLFQSIRAAEASGHYARIEAHYDQDFGYPTKIVFTTTKEIRDGNAIIEVRAFKNLAGP